MKKEDELKELRALKDAVTAELKTASHWREKLSIKKLEAQIDHEQKIIANHFDCIRRQKEIIDEREEQIDELKKEIAAQKDHIKRLESSDSLVALNATLAAELRGLRVIIMEQGENSIALRKEKTELKDQVKRLELREPGTYYVDSHDPEARREAFNEGIETAVRFLEKISPRIAPAAIVAISDFRIRAWTKSSCADPCIPITESKKDEENKKDSE